MNEKNSSRQLKGLRWKYLKSLEKNINFDGARVTIGGPLQNASGEGMTTISKESSVGAIIQKRLIVDCPAGATVDLIDMDGEAVSVIAKFIPQESLAYGAMYWATNNGSTGTGLHSSNIVTSNNVHVSYSGSLMKALCDHHCVAVVDIYQAELEQ